MDKDEATRILERSVSQSVMYKLQRHMPINISELGFTKRTYEALMRSHHVSLTEIMGMTDRDFFRIKQLGKSGMDEINALKQKLHDAGFFILKKDDAPSAAKTSTETVQEAEAEKASGIDEKAGCVKFYAYYLPGIAPIQIPEDCVDTVKTVLRSLKNEKQMGAVILRFGLNASGKQCSNKDIAVQIRVDEPVVNTLLNEAKKAFSHPARYERLIYGNKKYAIRETNRIEKHKAELNLIQECRKLRKRRTMRIITDRRDGRELTEGEKTKIQVLLKTITEPKSVTTIGKGYAGVKTVAKVMECSTVDALFTLKMEHYLQYEDLTSQAFQNINKLLTDEANAAAAEYTMLQTAPDDALDIVPLALIGLPDHETGILKSHSISTLEGLMGLTNEELADIDGIEEAELSTIYRTCAHFLKSNPWAMSGREVLDTSMVAQVPKKTEVHTPEKASEKVSAEPSKEEVAQEPKQTEPEIPGMTREEFIKSELTKAGKPRQRSSPAENRWAAVEDYKDKHINGENEDVRASCKRLYMTILTGRDEDPQIPEDYVETLDYVMKTCLEPTERVVLMLHYGLLEDGQAWPLQKLSDTFMVTKSRVSQVEIKAIRKLYEEEPITILRKGNEAYARMMERGKLSNIAKRRLDREDPDYWTTDRIITEHALDDILSDIDHLETKIAILINSSLPINTLPLSDQAATALEQADLHTIGEIMVLTEYELRDVPGLEHREINEIKGILIMQLSMVECPLGVTA